MTDPSLSFTDFLERMKDPRAADLVRDIRAFVKSFDGRRPDPDRDAASAQAFFEAQAAAFAAHPLWAGAPPAVLEAAGEGLEKYVMTKIHASTFGASPLDVERDEALALRLRGLAFVEPAHLDMPPGAVDERAVGLAGRELLKVNQFKAPRDKLVCILNCCRVLTNALSQGTAATTAAAASKGADDFLPALIYTLIKAAPPHLASNLEYVQRFRSSPRLGGGEASYFFMQLYGAASFVETVNATSLSVEPEVFVARMAAAGVPDMQLLAGKEESAAAGGSAGGGASAPHVPVAAAAAAAAAAASPRLTSRGSGASAAAAAAGTARPPTAAELEAEGVALVHAADADGSLASAGHAFLYKEPTALSLGELPALLQSYKDAVLKAEAVCRAADARAAAWAAARPPQQPPAPPPAMAPGDGGLASVSAEDAAPAVEAAAPGGGSGSSGGGAVEPPAPSGGSGSSGGGAVEPPALAALAALVLSEDGAAGATAAGSGAPPPAPVEGQQQPRRREEPPSLL